MVRLVLVLAVALWAGAAMAADSVRVAPPPAWTAPVELPRTPLDAGAQPAASGIRHLLEDVQVRFGSAGVEVFHHSAERIETLDGLAAGNLRIDWDPATDVLTVHHVHIIRGDQTIDALAKGQSFTVLRRETDLQRAMLNGVLTATLEVQGLEVGDVLDVAYTLMTNDPALNGRAQFTAALTDSRPVESLHVRELWPTDRQVRWKEFAGLPTAAVKQWGGDTELRIDGSRIQRPEPPAGSPSRYAAVAMLEASSFAGWSDVSAVMAPLYLRAAQLDRDSALRAEAARIRANSSDPKVQAGEALALVQSQIRYFYLGLNDGGYVPAAADLTWSRRFGDCKGKTVVLLALLHELGIAAEPALVSTTGGDALPERLPTVAPFDHVIVRAHIGGKTYWLDGTGVGDRSLADLEAPPFFWALPVQPTAAALVPIIAPPLSRPNMQVDIHVDASRGLDAPAPAHIDMIYRGALAAGVQLVMAPGSGVDLEQQMRAQFSQQYTWLALDKFAAFYDPAIGAERVTLDGTATLPWANLSPGARQLQLGAPLLILANGLARGGSSSDAPLVVPHPNYFKVTMTLLLPDKGRGVTVRDPDVSKTIADISYEDTAKLEDGIVTVTSSARTIAPEFPASGAAAARKEIGDLATKRAYLIASIASAPGMLGVGRNRLTPGTNAAAAAGAQGPDQMAGSLSEAGAAAPAHDPATTFIDRAYEAERRADYDTAIRDYDRAAALKPNDAAILNNRCFARAEADKDLPLALADCNASMALHSNAQADVLDSRALVYLRMNRMNEAIADADAALTLNPRLAASLYVRGLAEQRIGQKQTGDADTAIAEAMDPSLSQTYKTFGVSP